MSHISGNSKTMEAKNTNNMRDYQTHEAKEPAAKKVKNLKIDINKQ